MSIPAALIMSTRSKLIKPPMPAPFRIRFTLDKEVGKSDARLRMRVRWNGNSLSFLVGYRVEVGKWSADAQRCKSNSFHGARRFPAWIINKEITRCEDVVRSIFESFAADERVPSVNELKKSFFLKIRGKELLSDGDDLTSLFDQFMSEVGANNGWSVDTYKKFVTLRNHVTAFTTDPVTKFNEKKLNEFVHYMRDDKKMRNSTILKNVKFLKWFLRWAKSRGFVTNTDFETFSAKLKTTQNTVVFLEWNELMDVYFHEFPQNKRYLDRVRDVFCFCCFTSLRYSDVAALKRHNIVDGCLRITTKKTSDTLVIELNEYSSAILKKYENAPFKDNAVLPIISNQRMNEYLKEVCRDCGITTPIALTYFRGNERVDEVKQKWELVGTHTGRRTFICNALMLGIPPDVVMKWTGHSDYNSMKPYIGIADSAKAEAMKKFNKR